MATVSKALGLLDHFSKKQPEIGLSELARRAEIDKATTLRFLQALTACGVLEQNNESRAYRIGPTVVRWAAIRESTTSLKTLAQPILSELAQATGETAHLSLLENKRLETLIYCESSAHSARVVMSDADYLPLHATASGHAVLSASSEEFVDEILASELPNYTGATLTSPASVRTKIITDRRAMISKTMGTFDGDVAGTAAPIFGPAEEVIGAIAIAGLASRITADLDYKICQVLPQAARDISRQCGGRIPKIVEQAWHHG